MKSQSHLTMQSQPNAQRLNRPQHSSAAASARPASTCASSLLLLLLLAATVLNLTGCGGGWGETAPKAGVVVANSPSVGGTLTLHAAPAGTGPFTFQWFKNGVPVPGATAAAYSVVVQAGDNGASYTVAITSAGGTAISAPFVLNMGIAPAITAQPKDGTVAAGQTATLSVEATGTAPLAYQWFRNGVILNGATGAAYTTPVSSPADTGSVFTVTVANPIGTVTSAPATLTVTTLSAPLAFNLIPGKTYGDPAFPISATSASPGTVTYSVVSGPATLSGSNLTVNGAGTVVLAASQNAAGNYAAATATTSFAVSPATPVLSFQTLPSKTFGDPAFSVLATSASPGPVTYSISAGPATLSGSILTAGGVGTVSVTASQAATPNYTAATASASFNVAPAAPALAFTPIAPHTYGDPAFTVLASSSSPGLVTYAVDSGPATIAGSTLTPTGVGTITLSAAQAATGNYSSATATTTFAINPATPTLSFTPVASHIYGDPAFVIAATSASSAPVTYTVTSGPATLSGSTLTSTGVGTITLSAAQSATGNYNSATASTTFAVTPATPTLSFTPIAPHIYGDPAFTIAATSVSSAPVTYTVTSGPATLSGSTLTVTGTGAVALSAAQSATGNYSSATATTTFAVNPATPTLSFTLITPHIYGDPAFTIAATSASSAPVTYTVTSGPATLSGSTLTITGTGAVALSAAQAATGNYNSATATTTFAVTPATPTLTFTPIAPHIYGDPAFNVAATSASSATVTYTVTSGPATLSGSTLTVTGTGAVALSASQAATGNYSSTTASTTFAVTPATPTLSFTPITPHIYGDPAFNVAATSASSAPVTYTVTSGPATINGSTLTLTGAGTVILSAAQAAGANYAAATASTTVTVAAATPTLSFTSIPSKTFGSPAFNVAATSASSAPVTYTVTSGPATLSGSTVTITGSGPVTLAATQAATGNYSSATASTTFSISAATPTLTFNALTSKTYGDQAFAIAATSPSTGAIAYSVASGPATIAGSTVTLTGAGTVILTASQAADANYAAATASTNVTIAPATPTLSFATIPAKTYGNPAFSVSATSASSAPVTYTVTSGPATINGSTLTLTGAGPVTVAASQPATTNYAAASATTTVTIAPATPTLSFPTISARPFGSPAFAIAATSPSTGAITYSVTSGPASLNGSTLTLTGAGAVTLAASQAATANYTAATAATSFNVTGVIAVGAIAPANQTVGSGQITFAATASGGATNTLTWTASGGAFSGSTWTAPSTAGTYTITATSADDSTTHSTTTITVAAPVITTQPVSQSLCTNGSAMLSVAANYAGAYQWYLGASPLSGATGTGYFIASAQPTLDAGNYTVVVTNPAGSVTSSVAAVAVGSSITTNPQNLSVNATQTATFSVSITGKSPFTYQWYLIPSGASTGTAIAGATASTYTTAALSTSANSSRYYVIVTDSCGTPMTSTSATLSVASNNVPPTITTQPLGVIVPIGGTTTLTAAATGTPALTYQWFRIPAGSVTSTAVAGATSPTYTVPPSATALGNDQDAYYVMVTNAYGQAASQNASIVVGNGVLLQITDQPVNAYVGTGNAATFSVAVTSALPVTYQWFRAAPGSSTFAAISGATAPTYTLPSTSASDTGAVFYVRATNGQTTPVISHSAALFVGTLPSISSCSTNWGMVGDAITSGSCAYQLTAATTSQHGEIVWPSLLATGNIKLSFTIAVSNPSSTPADGFAVVLGDPSLGATPTSIGANGEGIGARGIPGFVLVFDTFLNNLTSSFPQDPTVPYLGVTRGESALWENPYFNVNTAIPALAAQNTTVTHSYVVSIVKGNMTVTMDGAQVFSGSVNVPPVAYLYVTSSTGGSYEKTVISNIAATISAP